MMYTLRLVCCVCIILVHAILEAQGQVRPGPADAPIAARFNQVITEYVRGMSARVGKPNREQLQISRAAVATRDERLRALLETAKSAEPNSLTAADLASLAEACELLLERENAIQFAQRSIALDADRTEAYQSFIRSLLNLNRFAEAEAVYASIDKRFPPDSIARAIHYSIFRKYLFLGKNSDAVIHGDLALDCHLKRGNIEDCRSALVILPDWIDAYIRLGRWQDARERLVHVRSDLTKLQDRIKNPENGAASNPNDLAIAQRLLAISELKTYLCLFTEPDHLPTEQALWLDEFFGFVTAKPERWKNLRLIQPQVAFAERFTTFGGDLTPLETSIERNGKLLESQLPPDKDASAAKAMQASIQLLDRYRQLVSFQKRLRLQIGTQPPSLNAVQWHTPPDDAIQPSKPNLIVLIPAASLSATSRQFVLSDWAKMLHRDGLVSHWLVVKSQPSGGTTESSKELARIAETLSSAQTKNDERNQFSVGSITSMDPRIRELSDPKRATIVVVDDQGVIRHVVVGLSVACAEFVRHRLKSFQTGTEARPFVCGLVPEIGNRLKIDGR